MMGDISEAYEFSKALTDVYGGWAALKPPKRMTVAEGIAANLVISQTGGTTAPWDVEETPYMVEPANALASRGKEAVIFAGPARCSKT